MDDSETTSPIGDASWRRSLASRLLSWFDRHARDLPWRRTGDLYAIWISEIMLQQTQVATVIGYFERFMATFGSVQELAAAPERHVLRLWEGLGYYRRARQLHAAARRIVSEHGGKFPQTAGEVLALPGIGRYTAGAILSIGLDQRLPILEANTIRLLSRLTAFRGDTASADGQRHLWATAEKFLPRRRCGAFNQALMELGSEICTPKSPDCGRCPLARLCPTRELELQAEIPAAKKPKQYEEITEAALVVRRGNRVLLRQCESGERWAGLWDFPRFPLERRLLPAAGARNGMSSDVLQQHLAERMRSLTGVTIDGATNLASFRHGVTRFRITLEVFAASTRTRRGTWVTLADLAEYPLSTTGRKIARLLLAGAKRATPQLAT